jgi:hypothetical protein
LRKFIIEFHEENPLSHLAIVSTSSARASLISDFASNKNVHVRMINPTCISHLAGVDVSKVLAVIPRGS